MQKNKGKQMDEQIVTTTPDVADVTPEVNTTVEPTEVETHEAEVSEEVADVPEEAGKQAEVTLPDTLKDVPEGFIKKFGEIDLSNPANANLVKSAYHSEKTMNETLNKVAQLEKAQQEQQFTQQKAQVSQEHQQLDYYYQQELSKFQEQGNQVLTNALEALQNGEIDGAYYAQIVAEENSKFLNAKANIDAIYQENSSKIKSKELELSKQATANSFREFEINNAERLAKPEGKALYEAFKAQGFDPQELNTAFELAETYLQTYIKQEAAKKAISSEIQAEKSAMSSTVGKGGTGNKATKEIKTLDDIINNY